MCCLQFWCDTVTEKLSMGVIQIQLRELVEMFHGVLFGHFDHGAANLNIVLRVLHVEDQQGYLWVSSSNHRDKGDSL